MSVQLQNDETRPEMDELLRDYYRSEMPQPWPAFRTPKPARAKKPVTFSSRFSGRLALAACVALLVAGYLTLAGYFPRVAPSSGLHEVTPAIGKNVNDKKKMPLPKINPNDDVLPMPQ